MPGDLHFGTSSAVDLWLALKQRAAQHFPYAIHLAGIYDRKA
jgi:hypothetical protein